MRKLWKTIGCIWPMIAAYLCQLVISSIGVAVYVMVLTFDAAMDGVETLESLRDYMLGSMSDSDVVLIIGGIAIAATLLIGALWYRKYRPQGALTFKETLNVKLIAAMVMMGISLQVLISLCLNFIYPLLPQSTSSEYSDLMEALIGGNTWLSIVVTVILAPLAEEFLFRGVTLEKAKKIMPFFAANIVQALMFGIYHGNLIQGVYAFGLGMVLGYVADYFHSIWASIFLHACVNGSAQLISLLNELMPESPVGSFVGLLLLAAVGVAFLIAAGKLFPHAKAELPKPQEPTESAENKEFKEFTENSFDEYNV